MRFAIFPLHLSKVLRLPRKSDTRSYEVLSRKIILANLKIWCSKTTSLRKSTPWPPNISDEHVFCTAPATRNASSRSSSNAPRLPSFLEMLQNPHVLFAFGKVQNPLRPPRKNTSKPSKVVRPCGACSVLTWKCASRHNGVHLFDISTSKSDPELACSAHFDSEMCFAPQLNFQKRSDTEVRCPFWLGNLLRAPTACNFSSLIRPDGSAPATLASLLFDPPGPQIIGKRQWIATFLSFRAPASSFFWLFLFSDLLSSLLFSSLLFSDSYHLCFSICPYCRKFDF